MKRQRAEEDEDEKGSEPEEECGVSLQASTVSLAPHAFNKYLHFCLGPENGIYTMGLHEKDFPLCDALVETSITFCVGEPTVCVHGPDTERETWRRFEGETFKVVTISDLLVFLSYVCAIPTFCVPGMNCVPETSAYISTYSLAANFVTVQGLFRFFQLDGGFEEHMLDNLKAISETKAFYSSTSALSAYTLTGRKHQSMKHRILSCLHESAFPLELRLDFLVAHEEGELLYRPTPMSHTTVSEKLNLDLRIITFLDPRYCVLLGGACLHLACPWTPYDNRCDADIFVLKSDKQDWFVLTLLCLLQELGYRIYITNAVPNRAHLGLADQDIQRPEKLEKKKTSLASILEGRLGQQDKEEDNAAYSFSGELNQQQGASVFSAVGPIGKRRVQIVVASVTTAENVMRTFDFWALCACYDGTSLIATVGAHHDWLTKTATTRGYRIHARRVLRMQQKGFAVSKKLEDLVENTIGFGKPVKPCTLKDYHHCYPYIVPETIVPFEVQDAMLYRCHGLTSVAPHSLDRFARVNYKHWQVNSYVSDDPKIYLAATNQDLVDVYAEEMCFVKPQGVTQGKLPHAMILHHVLSEACLEFMNVRLMIECFHKDVTRHGSAYVQFQDALERKNLCDYLLDFVPRALGQSSNKKGHFPNVQLHVQEALWCMMPHTKIFCDGLPHEVRRPTHATICDARILMRPGHFYFPAEALKKPEESEVRFKWYITHIYFNSRQQDNSSIRSLEDQEDMTYEPSAKMLKTHDMVEDEDNL